MRTQTDYNFQFAPDAPEVLIDDEAQTKQNRIAKFRRYSMTDLMQVQLPKWLLRDLIFEKQIVVFYSPSGSYKSFVAVALSSMLAHGMDWQGRQLKPSSVVYLAGEGFTTLGMRRLAWFKHHGIAPTADAFEVIDGTVNLLEPDDVDAFIESMRDHPTDLTVIDTLSTSCAGQDENSSAVMTAAVTSAIKIKRELGSAVLIIHHPGKDIERGLRGHSSLKANIDAVVFGEKIEEGRKAVLTTVKQRDGEDGKIFTFSVHRVPLGIYDDDGIEMVSLAVEPCETPASVLDRRNDLTKIATVLFVDQPMTISKVADQLIEFKLVNCKKRAAQTRISKAVPPDWIPVEKAGKLYEMRRITDDVKGAPHKIILRTAEPEEA